MQNLNLRYPLLYTTPNCIYYQTPEDILHLFTCSKQKYNLQQTLQSLISNTAQQLNISSELQIKSILFCHNKQTLFYTLTFLILFKASSLYLNMTMSKYYFIKQHHPFL